MSMPITQHFALDEFACHDGTPYPIDTVEDGTGIPTNWTPSQQTWFYSRLTPLCLTLETIRAAAVARYGLTPEQAAMAIDSGFRTIAYDEKIYDAHVAAVGDDGLVAPASKSIHPKGGAADVKHAKLTPSQLYNLVLDLFSQGQLPYLGGVGLYPSFVHIDVRTRTVGGSHLAIWGGERPSNIV
jgi:hypothetical protein